MANTYTWNTGNGAISNAADWTPSGIDLSGGATNSDDSLILSNNNGSQPYAVTFGSEGDAFSDLIINYGGADFEGDPGGGGFYTLNVYNSIFVQAGTFDLGDYTEVNASATLTKFEVDGILQGTGVLDTDLPTLTGTGTLLALNENDPTTLLFNNEISGTLHGEVATGATIEFAGVVNTGFVVTLADPTSGDVQIDNLAGFHGAVAGLGIGAGSNANPGSFIDLQGVNQANITNVSFNGGVISLTDAADGGGTIAVSGSYTGDFVNYIGDGSGGTDVFFSDTVCFASGTHILTPDGNVPVELISAGDQVIAIVAGRRISQPVKWVGYRKLVLNHRARSAGLAPIRIKRGAVAEELPERDLLVSSPHCLFLDRKLIPAKLLVNDMSIVWDTTLALVEYYHIELDRHAVIIAEGVEAESYLDTGNRAFFSNAGLALLLHPEFHLNAGLRCWATDACAPLAVSPAAVLPVWRVLADRAVALGYVAPVHATTSDADIHLVADGHRIDTIAVNGQMHSFMVPAGVKSLTLDSRSVVPSVLVQYLDDPRQIGVAVSGITIRGMAGRAEFSADHPALSRGWHVAEQADKALWRWTNGHASLPVSVVAGPVVIDVTVSETTTYQIDQALPTARLAA